MAGKERWEDGTKEYKRHQKTQKASRGKSPASHTRQLWKPVGDWFSRVFQEEQQNEAAKLCIDKGLIALLPIHLSEVHRHAHNV